MKTKWIQTLAVTLLLANSVYNPTAWGSELFSSELNYTSSYDSDGVNVKAWRMTTLNEDSPWNLALYRTRIDQGIRSLQENTAVAKYRAAVSDGYAVSAWLGFSNNDIVNFHPFALMYDGPVSTNGHFWLSYGKESLQTITAYEAGIFGRSTGLGLLYNLSPGVDAKFDFKHTSYSDDNSRNTALLTITRQADRFLKVKAGLTVDDADHKATGYYYVPVNERAAFIGGEWSVPLGDANLLISGERSLFAKNSEGTIQRYSASAEVKMGQFSTGIRYNRSGDYWAHTWNAAWQQQW